MSSWKISETPKKRGLMIRVVDNHIDKALSRFKKVMKESGVLEEYRERQEFVPPSAKRRKALNRAKKKQQSAQLNIDVF